MLLTDCFNTIFLNYFLTILIIFEVILIMHSILKIYEFWNSKKSVHEVLSEREVSESLEEGLNNIVTD